MKFCTHCGQQVNDEAVICVHCGCSIQNPVTQQSSDDTLATVIKVFMIIGCIAQGWMVLPLAWCIPMTISVFNSFKQGRPISTAMKVCTLLFVNMIAGICMLCMNDNQA